MSITCLKIHILAEVPWENLRILPDSGMLIEVKWSRRIQKSETRKQNALKQN